MNAKDEVSQVLGGLRQESPLHHGKPTGKPTQEMARATGMEMRLNDCDYRDHTTRGATVSRCPFFFRG